MIDSSRHKPLLIVSSSDRVLITTFRNIRETNEI
jgi:hypothetical protein